MQEIGENCDGCGGTAGRKKGKLPYRTNDGRPLCKSCQGVRAEIGVDVYADVHEPGALTILMRGVDEHGRVPSGGEEWSWRPYRVLCPEDAEIGATPISDSPLVVGRPPPPMHVKGTRDPAATNRHGVALPRSTEDRQREAARAVRAVLDASSLTAHQREIYRLRRLEGLSREAIAERLGCTELAVKRALERASTKVRSAIVENELRA